MATTALSSHHPGLRDELAVAIAIGEARGKIAAAMKLLLAETEERPE